METNQLELTVLANVWPDFIYRPTPAPTSPPTINPWDNPTSSRVHDGKS